VLRDVSTGGAFVEASCPIVIPLYRLVHLQLERELGGSDTIPERLRDGRMLSAVWRVGPCRRSTGTPDGYALRFLVDPHENACDKPSEARMAVAS
jgi:hypothetical protein